LEFFDKHSRVKITGYGGKTYMGGRFQGIARQETGRLGPLDHNSDDAVPGPLTGSSTVKMAPLPSPSLLADTVPPCNSTR
jgi:hypothetical protein